MVVSVDMPDSYDSESSISSSEKIETNESSKRKRKGAKDTSDAHTAKVYRGNLYKPPTNDELQALKQTENTFHSSLFRLQVSELLSEVSVKVKWRNEMQDFLKQLEAILMKAKKGLDHELSDTSWLENTGLKLPLHLKPTGLKGRFQFFPPKVVKVVGSFVTNTTVKPQTDVDVVVEMPKECLQGKDYLNQRYLRKRAMYLTYLSMHLSKWSGQSQLSFTLHHGSQVKPVLHIQPAGKLGSHLCVRLHVVAEKGYFKHNRFHITKNNVRRRWFMQENAASPEDDDDQLETPQYNTEVLSDLTALENSAFVEGPISCHQSLQQGIQLLKVWLHQRELSQGYGSFNGFLLSMYIVYLLKKGRLNGMMSSYQIVRNVLFQLSSSDWCSEGVSLCEERNDLHLPTLQHFHQHFAVVFVDPSGFNNLCAHMASATFKRVKHEASLAIEYLETPGVDAFDALFMKPVPFIRKFDQIVHISNLHHLEKTSQCLGLSDKLLDYSGDFVKACIQGIINLLHQALGKRLLLLDIRLEPCPKWSVNEKPPGFEEIKKISIGFLLNSDTCNSVLEKGPPADSLEAMKFRSFWGEMAELRRFQDGSICEAVVWDCKTVAERRRVVGKIVKLILNRHCDIPRDSITVIGSQLDEVLRLPDPRKKKKKKDLEESKLHEIKFVGEELVYGTGEEQHTAVMRVYDELCKELRSLRDLPLGISTVHGTAEVFRYSQVFPMLPAPYTASVLTREGVSCPLSDQPAPPFTPAISVLCMLEASGKWPDDLEAVKRVKAAFHLQLSSLLNSKCNLQTNAFPTHVDVFKGGFVFRVEVGYSKEVVLMKTVRTSEGMVKMVDTEESHQLERKYTFIPKLTTTLQSIQQRYPSYCSSVRLAKRWLAAHMFLGEYIPEDAADLIMAHIYLHPAPYQVPGGPLAGFLRFLYLLSSWDWKAQPMLVNLNEKFTVEDYMEIKNQFSKNRSTLPLMYISTPEDKHTSYITKRHPSAPILNRVAVLALESLNVLQSQLEHTYLGVDFKHVFRPPVGAFDLVIHLDRDQVSTRHQALDATPQACLPFFKRLTRPLSAIPVLNYNPAQIYVKELQAAFGDLALFFYDIYGGSVVGVIWKPQALSDKPFQISHITGHMLKTSDSTMKLTPNVEAMVADMKYIGQGLVCDVQLNTEKWNV